MKKLLIIILCIFLLEGCDNKVEEEKKDYLSYKEELQTKENFSQEEDMVCNITTSIDKISNEEISYRVIIDNPKINMYNVKAMIIHNYFTEDVFPSIGIFDETQNLIIDSQDVKGITLVGYIETNKEIKDLNLELRTWISYEDNDGNIKQIYYKSTN